MAAESSLGTEGHQVKMALATSESPLASWLSAMVDGIRSHYGLVHFTARRLAPESVVVACAAMGLATRFSELDVLLEAASENPAGSRIRRVDLVVGAPGTPSFAFEWKVLWCHGVKEFIRGVNADRSKLRGHPRAAVVGFAYAVRGKPLGSRAISNAALAQTVTAAEQSLGQAHLRSGPVRLDPDFDFELLVWGIGAASSAPSNS